MVGESKISIESTSLMEIEKNSLWDEVYLTYLFGVLLYNTSLLSKYRQKAFLFEFLKKISNSELLVANVIFMATRFFSMSSNLKKASKMENKQKST